MSALRKFKPGGVVFRCDGWAEREMYTSTCSHCQRITEFPDLRRMTDYIDFCRSCMEEVCIDRKGPNGQIIPGCAGRPCVTWLKKCDIDEALDRRKFWGNVSQF